MSETQKVVSESKSKKIAVVTGGSRGIGKEIALALSKKGYAVAILANSEPQLGEGIKSYKCNVADFAAVKETSEKIAADFGGVDVLVNNAGIVKDNLAIRMTESEFDDVLAVNLKGVFNCCKHFARSIMKSSHGRIINISSISGITGLAGQANYAASKGGIIALTKVMARELGGRGVTVNAIAPGFIETDMTSGLDEAMKQNVKNTAVIKRLGNPSDIAAAVVFLAGEEAGYITGQTIVVDGGLTL